MDAKTVEQAAMAKVAGDILAAMTTEERTAILHAAVLRQIESLGCSYDVRRAIDAVIKEEAATILQEPAMRQIISTKARAALEVILPAIEATFAELFLDNFRGKDSYSHSAFHDALRGFLLAKYPDLKAK